MSYDEQKHCRMSMSKRNVIEGLRALLRPGMGRFTTRQQFQLCRPGGEVDQVGDLRYPGGAKRQSQCSRPTGTGASTPFDADE